MDILWETFSTVLWKLECPALKITIYEKKWVTDEKSPPRFPSCPDVQHVVTAVSASECSVRQLKGRHPEDTAFIIEQYASSNTSDLTLHYCIGTHKGGQNVRHWTEMRGGSQMVPAQLPNGIPLYWTVRANSSQGLISYGHCKLDTYDNTLPDGKVRPSYQFTSHPNKLSAIIEVDDDSPLLEVHNVSLGYSPGQFGREVQDVEPFYLNEIRSDVTNDLKYFSPPKSGKLAKKPYFSAKKADVTMCAQECIAYGEKCHSFDFELHTLFCDLHELTESPDIKLQERGSYQNYERLGLSTNSYKEYSVTLEHGARYYINVQIYNTLGYNGYLNSSGTLVDFTPPEPGLIVNGTKDVVINDGCHAAITQRCIELASQPNHR